MAKTYYLGFTSDGRPVGRHSTRSDFTHAAVSVNPHAYGLPNFSTSAAAARALFEGAHARGGECEVVEVQVVDRKTYMSAFPPKEKVFDEVTAILRQRAEQPRPAPVLPEAAPTTREAWMLAFTDASRTMFAECGAPLPEAVRVSIGHPSKGTRSKVIGECWSNLNSGDGAVEIFIRPTLQSDTSRVADVLTHELIHAALGIDEGHGHNFRRVMKALGLEGKATATVAGPGWHTWADPILEALGPLPGAALNDGSALSGGKKKQTTRMLKLECPECGFSCRTTAKHIEAHDELRCPVSDCGGQLAQA
jgi:hypothetical protein